ncbi:MAG: NlpC/P60 family protein [Candidatus Margulisiibacteriota bacterium]
MLIDKYLGIPYVHKGRTLDGLDCWGLLKRVYGNFGIDLFDIEEYSKTWSLTGRDYFKQYYEQDWVMVGCPRFLDAVLFVNSKGIANHAGIVLMNGRFIHSCRQGVIVSRLNDKAWRKNIEGYYRLKNDKNT